MPSSRSSGPRSSPRHDDEAASWFTFPTPRLRGGGPGGWGSRGGYLYQAAPPGVSAEEIQSIVLQIAGPEGAEDAMNAAQELIERGRAEGEAKGEARGEARGKVEGKAEGLRAAIAAVFSA